MRERATEVTRRGPDPSLAYARVAAELVIVADASPQPDGRLKAVDRRLREALAPLHVSRHAEKAGEATWPTGRA